MVRRTGPPSAGIESAALSGWPLLKGTGWNGFIWVDGKATEVMAYFLSVSPGWTDTMGVRLLDGRDLLNTETSPGAALVNEAFVQQCFHGRNPIVGMPMICASFHLCLENSWAAWKQCEHSGSKK